MTALQQVVYGFCPIHTQTVAGILHRGKHLFSRLFKITLAIMEKVFYSYHIAAIYRSESGKSPEWAMTPDRRNEPQGHAGTQPGQVNYLMQ